MGLFSGLFGNNEPKLPPLDADDSSIVAPADGELIDVTKVSDPVFAEKMMGDSIAFAYDTDKTVICAPANGTLTVLFPTGHAFGITMKNGIELLVHIGINTVETKGDGFKIFSRKQGDTVKAGDPIVEVDMKKLKAVYDMSVILIVTNANGHQVKFISPGRVARGQKVIQ